MTLLDTDILIWLLRGHPKACQFVENQEERSLSVVSYLELTQGIRSKQELKFLKKLLFEGQFETIPLSYEIGCRAALLMEAYHLSSGLGALDALIAATALERNKTLYSGNQKHFKPISGLNFKVFTP